MSRIRCRFPGSRARTAWLVVAAALGVAVAVSASAAPRIRIYPGQDFPGGDYRTLPNTRHYAYCARACQREQRCVAFTWNRQNRNCYLKDRAGSRPVRAGAVAIAGRKVGTVAAPRPRTIRPRMPRMRIYPGQDFPGGDYRTLPNTRHYSLCMRACQRERRCVAFTWNRRNRNCYLKNRAGSRPVRAGAVAVAGRKVGAPAATRSARDSLGVGQSLRVGGSLTSPNGRFLLAMQGDGNLVVYDKPTNRPLWASNTRTKRGKKPFAVLQGDGNFVVYGVTRIWATGTMGRGGNRLVMQNDGNLVLYASGRAVWASNTVQRPLPPRPTRPPVPHSTTGSPSRGFYVIAHMTNTPAAAVWAMREGANAVEVDIGFHGNGTPKSFRHGGICDCACAVLTFAGKHHVCTPLRQSCSVSSPVPTLLQTLAGQGRLALVIIDSKISAAESVASQRRAGEQVVAALDQHLFGRGYRGKAIVGVASTETLAYLQAAAGRAQRSPNRARIYFSIDMEGKTSSDAGCTIQSLSGVSKNRAYGTGISACASGNYRPAIVTAAQNRARGVVGLVYAWTLDKESSMEAYIAKGANGIITNYPAKLLALVKKKGLHLATPDTPIPTATSDQVIGASSCGCDCNYHPGGCVIHRPAPPGRACKCKYKGAWTCGGSVVRCSNPSSPLCRKPDTSVAACVLGGGDCDGYKAATCDCNYSPGGCKISRPSPQRTACKCSYKGAWTCGGSVVRCRNESSPQCQRPDRSMAACIQGGGDCDGYKSATCDCNYERGGCYISKPAPKGMACRCKYKGAWTCGGSVVACRNPSSRYCTRPDYSKHSCWLGGGDCDAKRYK